jgi:hypothetical protein
LIRNLIRLWTRGPLWQSFAISLLIVLPLVVLTNLARLEVHSAAVAARAIVTRTLMTAALLTLLLRLASAPPAGPRGRA